MKIATIVIPVVLCVLLLILPVFELVGLINGLEFVLFNETAVVITQTVLCVGSAVAIFILKPEYERTGRIFWMLALPVSLLNALCFADRSMLSVILAVIWSAAVFAVYIKFVPDSGFKATSAVFSVLAAVAFAVIFIVFGIFEPIVNERTVNSSLASPAGTYSAETVTVKTPLSEKMNLDIRKTEPEMNAVLGAYYKKTVTVYEGESYETQTAKISWKDDSTVVVNGTEYPV